MIHPPSGSAKRASVALLSSENPERAGMFAVAEAAAELGRASVRSVLIFAAGEHARCALEVATGAGRALPNATIVVSGGVDVMAPGGESDGASTLSVLALTTDITVAHCGPGGSPRVIGERLGREVFGGPSTAYVFLARSHLFDPACVDGFYDAVGTSCVLGGGISERAMLAVKRPGEDAERCAALALRFDAGVRMAIGVTPGVVPLTDLLIVERIEEGFITRLGGRRPLDLLSEATRRRGERSLVLAMIAPRGEGHHRPNQCLVRGITGMNPPRGAIHLGPEVRIGDRVGFATPDAHAACEDFRTMHRAMDRSLQGGEPLAGLFIGCGSRGSRLFAKPGVDTRLLRAALGSMPFAGMHSSFEIGPFDGRPRMHVYSGVLAVLYAPS